MDHLLVVQVGDFIIFQRIAALLGRGRGGNGLSDLLADGADGAGLFFPAGDEQKNKDKGNGTKHFSHGKPSLKT